MISKINFSHIFFLLCLSVLFYLTWIMAKPFVAAIIFAGILAGAFYPLQKLMLYKWGFSKKIASFITCIVIFILVIVPVVYVGLQLSREVIGFYKYVSEGFSQAGVKDFFYGDGRFAVFLKEAMETFDMSPKQLEKNILDLLQLVSSYSIGFINSWVGNLLGMFMKFAVMLVSTYGLLNWGESLKGYMFKLSPLPIEEEELLLKRFNQMNKVTLIVNGIGGIIQGTLAGCAFALAGFQSVFMWSVIMVILAFIPLVGISVVSIPASIYLMVTGHMVTGILLLIFCAIMAFAVENGLKPKLMGTQVKINSILLLLFILGGMGAWGMVGIFYGPVICTMVMTMIDIYHEKYAQDLVFIKDKENEIK